MVVVDDFMRDGFARECRSRAGSGAEVSAGELFGALGQSRNCPFEDGGVRLGDHELVIKEAR